jgi:hypothetical protein
MRVNCKVVKTEPVLLIEGLLFRKIKTTIKMKNQIKTYDFYRIDNTTRLAGMPLLGMIGPKKNRWYIDLPEWKGPKASLEMVLGADTMLDILSESNERINVTFSNYEHAEMDAEFKLEHKSNGYYSVSDLKGAYTLIPEEIWLCDVTKFVFTSDYPEVIYVRRNS